MSWVERDGSGDQDSAFFWIAGERAQEPDRAHGPAAERVEPIARSAAERKAAALRSKSGVCEYHAPWCVLSMPTARSAARRTRTTASGSGLAEEHFETAQDRQVRPRGRVGRLTLHERLIRIAQAAVFFAGEMLDELGELHEQP